MVKIAPITIWRPLLSGYAGLIIGHSNFSSRRILIIPGLIDEDYQGQIKS